MVKDANGGTIVTYQDNSGVDIDIRVQRFDASGKPLWGPNGVLVCGAIGSQYQPRIVSDGLGGAIIAWEDYRSGLSTQDLYMQRVLDSGSVFWTANGIPLCTFTGRQWNLSMVGDAAGGAYVAWSDERSSLSDIYLQKVTSLGAFSYTAGGLAVCTATGDQTEPNLILDALDSPVVVWTDARSGATDIYLQRYSIGGAPQLAASGIVVCNATGTQFAPRVVIGGQTELVVGWTDSRAGLDVYAQRIYVYSGAAQWAANGVPVCTAAGFQWLRSVVADGLGGYVFVWEDGRLSIDNLNLYIQKLDALGTGQWGFDGIPLRVSSGSVSKVRAAADGRGGAIFVWDDPRSGAADIYAQRISSQGWAHWQSNGVPIATSANVQTNADLRVTAGGGAHIAFTDFSGAYGVRIQAVDEWGYLGAEPVMAGVGDVPNDQGGQVRVAWYASPLDTDPLFRNIAQYLVFRTVSAPLATTLERAAPLRSDSPFTALGGRRFLRTSSNAANYFWEEVGAVTARRLAAYSFLAPTEGDSIVGSNPRTSFMVMALTDYGTSWWVSASDSGYSVDNLAPAAPAPFNGQYGSGSTALYWAPNAEADLAGYRLYRGTSPGFAIGPSSLVASMTETGYTDAAGQPYFYKLVAFDTHGNVSGASLLQPGGVLDAGDTPGALVAHFAAPRPNPVRPGGASTLRFAITQAGGVRLTLHDAQGRSVRVLVDGMRGAGEHAVAFDGRAADGRRLAPGLYLARLEAPGLSSTQRLVVIE